MRGFLKVLFAFIGLSLVLLSVWASLDRNVLDAARALWPDAWFRATLADAYAGFLTLYAWVFYKERTAGARILWLVLFLGLGNIAIASYVLIQLFKLREGEPIETLLLRRNA
jgi:hypothetical protein